MEQVIFEISLNGYGITIIMLIITIWTILVGFEYYSKGVKDSTKRN